MRTRENTSRVYGRAESVPCRATWERAFEERPEVFAAWQQLNGAIKAGMDLRCYELATLAAARRLRSSYCCLMHGKVLRDQFDEPVAEIARDHRAAPLGAVDVAVMDLAERVVDDATSIGDADLRPLRDLGLSDADIMDVVLAASARCFFSKTLDPLSVLPDASLAELEPELLEVLVVGRPNRRRLTRLRSADGPRAARARTGAARTPPASRSRRERRARPPRPRP
jgi:alkylhydroperoxidase family enzyme